MKLFQATAVMMLGLSPALLHADDWPMWGRDKTRNLVSPEKNPPTDWQVETRDRNGAIVKRARNIKWSARLGTFAVGAPAVANGLVWIGTNNQNPRDPGFKKDASVLMCFRESDGKFLWQYVSPRLESGQHNDWPHSSMGCSPLIEGDRLWLRTNRCETVCLDIGPLRRGAGEPKVLWKVDMQKEFGVYPAVPGMAMGFSPSLAAPYKDLIHVVTGNGVDEGHVKVPAPEAPSVIGFNKNTGNAVWKDSSPGKNILDVQMASPLVLEIAGRGQAIVPFGDGWLRSFDPETGKLLWKCDLNPKGSKYALGGSGTRNYVMATPVYHDGRIYLGVGQDPEHYEGVGYLYGIDPTKAGDISLELDAGPGKGKPNPNSAVVWRYGGPTTKEDEKRLKRDWYFGRTMSTVAVQDGLVYAAELAGYLHCLDARTGKHYWVHDLRSAVWGSPLWVNGKVYLCTEDGDVWIYQHGKEKKEPRKIEMDRSINSSPVFANGVLYLATTDSTLYAIQEKKP